MEKKISKRKLRVRYWKKIIGIQNGQHKAEIIKALKKKNTKSSKKLIEKMEKDSTTDFKLPFIKKGDKRYQIIMELARMPPKEIIQTASEYYRKYTKIAELLQWYNKGTAKEVKRKEGRKYITVVEGYPKHSPFVAHLIRHQLINHERGMIKLTTAKE